MNKLTASGIVEAAIQRPSCSPRGTRSSFRPSCLSYPSYPLCFLVEFRVGIWGAAAGFAYRCRKKEMNE